MNESWLKESSTELEYSVMVRREDGGICELRFSLLFIFKFKLKTSLRLISLFKKLEIHACISAYLTKKSDQSLSPRGEHLSLLHLAHHLYLFQCLLFGPVASLMIREHLRIELVVACRLPQSVNSQLLPGFFTDLVCVGHVLSGCR